ncbi:hypothetical protein BDA96_02G311900 [Sorghum bicolor]|uniref:Uncharacterized protein n=1 Tax=Sorghum bicolor TaxID=4558 RepID=A0A921RS44_SORBI|nr:hypothetical protein BDA96_02G311900 [Sorghum bicolor]
MQQRLKVARCRRRRGATGARGSHRRRRSSDSLMEPAATVQIQQDRPEAGFFLRCLRIKTSGSGGSGAGNRPNAHAAVNHPNAHAVNHHLRDAAALSRGLPPPPPAVPNQCPDGDQHKPGRRQDLC